MGGAMRFLYLLLPVLLHLLLQQLHLPCHHLAVTSGEIPPSSVRILSGENSQIPLGAKSVGVQAPGGSLELVVKKLGMPCRSLAAWLLRCDRRDNYARDGPRTQRRIPQCVRFG
jgi:hypothetical protein